MPIERLECGHVGRRDRDHRRRVLVDLAAGEAMSETLVSRRVPKVTCRKCNRTIHVVADVELDPELIQVLEFEKRNPQIIHARRLHAELCETYIQADKKTKLTAERRLWNLRQERRVARKAPLGRREPGQ